MLSSVQTAQSFRYVLYIPEDSGTENNLERTPGKTIVCEEGCTSEKICLRG